MEPGLKSQSGSKGNVLSFVPPYLLIQSLPCSVSPPPPHTHFDMKTLSKGTAGVLALFLMPWSPLFPILPFSSPLPPSPPPYPINLEISIFCTKGYWYFSSLQSTGQQLSNCPQAMGNWNVLTRPECLGWMSMNLKHDRLMYLSPPHVRKWLGAKLLRAKLWYLIKARIL